MISFNCCVYLNSLYGYYLFVNMWTSAAICYEVHQLLLRSHNAIRSTPLEPKTVIKRASIPHFFGILCVSVRGLILPQFGFHTGQNSCMGIRTTRTDIALFIFIGFIMAIPFLYICWITFDVHWRKLLPPEGKSRYLATFFLRTTIICALITVVTILGLSMRAEPSRILFIFSVSVQGLVVSGLSLLKPDLRKAFFSLICCGTKKDKHNPRTTSST